ncbi:MAG: site-2 protease family protein [Myxococcales bacterium]|nr:site-2 protease family protein [Myxococcales bacterium]
MNGWSWSIGRFFGIDTRVHATFLLLVGWAAFSAIEQGGTAFAALLSIAFLLAVFASVLLHELGHALTGRLYGIETRKITLSPLGGLAQLEAGMLPPRAELWVALAGPLVSFLLAGVFFTLAALTGEWSPSSFVGGLGWANLMIAAFNMLPAFPMDGGRVLRAGLAGRIGYRRATEIAARVGKIAAIGMMILGLFTRPLLLMIGVFVYLAASAEASQVRRFFAFGGGGGGGGRRVRRTPRGRGESTWYERWRGRASAPRRTDTQRIVDPGPPAGRWSEDDDEVIDPRVVYVRPRGRGGDPFAGGRRVRVYLDLH